MARGVAGAAALATPGFWCERFVYHSADADVVASWATVVTHSPVRAVRLISADARSMASGLPEYERERVVGRVNSLGQVDAMAALERNDSCRLALNCGGTWIEWSARPVLFLPVLPLVACAESPCPLPGERSGAGFGSPSKRCEGDGAISQARFPPDVIRTAG